MVPPAEKENRLFRSEGVAAVAQPSLVTLRS
ncbi:hypothetical protein CYJ76_07115 [Kytococcus schroeteri]|uniref:Uncharacterized protein n=2 Tax=Kytococcus schroeteri TaxID=138300 RepID=A0A2I1PAN7_9MICO|nr:hypothetical protein CYJ76_07115 [Kytococcus schroeteri]